jgi:hypothetical protein
MRMGIIVLAALCAALVVDAAWVRAALATVPHLDPATLALRHLGALALAGLAVYAVVALALVVALILLDATRVRLRLARLSAPDQRDWGAAFVGTALKPLATRLLDLAPLGRDWARSGIILQSRFDTALVRREVGQLYFGALVRAQFVTALALCAALAALGFVHDYAPLALAPAGIPAVPALVAIAVPALFAVLGWMIVGAAADSLCAAIADLPAERLDIELLRRLVWLSEEGDSARLGGPEAALSPAIGKLLARLIDALDEGRISLVEAMAGLSAQAEAVALAMRSAAERGAEKGEGRDLAPDLAEFQTAVAQLRAVMEGLAAAARQLPPAIAAGAGGGAEIGMTRSELGREVRNLLADLE